MEQMLRAAGCISRFTAGGLLLHASPGLPVRALNDGSGWVIGHLFERSGDPAPATLDPPAAMDTTDWLIDRFWGAYCLFTAGEERFEAMRDPSGGLPCYHARIGGGDLFTSLPSLPIDGGLLAAEIDWPMVLHSLTQRSERLTRTQLSGIDELLAGTRLTIGPASAEAAPVWDPWTFAGRPPEPDPAGRLEAVLGATLRAWGTAFPRPLIEISGGLDSAIVAAGLAAAAQAPALVTFAPAPGDPDETAYARAIADHLGLPLTIATLSLADVDLQHSLSRDLPRPNARAFTQAADRRSLALGRAIAADAFVSGGGGDDVFGYLRTVLPAIDRLHAEGPRAMLSTALDIATMTHATLWDALSRIARRLVRRAPSVSRVDLRFIAPGAAYSQNAAPPETDARHRLPGKGEHVRAVATIHNHLEGHARAEFAPILSPLLSQPIVECCLTIPTWAWCAGGRNRAVARAAVGDWLPGIVLERRSKGRFDGFCAALLDANRPLIRALLLDGLLAGQGLLDRPAVESALAAPFPPADVVSRLLVLVDVESWAAGWASRSAPRA